MLDAGSYGAPNWVDLATTDLEGASRFYRDLLGWRLQRTTSPFGEYVTGHVGERQIGGMMQFGPEEHAGPPAWTTVFYVAHVDDTAARAEAAGGAVLQRPFDLPESMRIAILADPTGAMFGVISGPGPHGAWLAREPGSVAWVELLTRHTAAAESFYATLFGWKAITDDGTMPYTTFKLGDEDVAGMMAMPAEVPDDAPSSWAVYFAVPDCAAAVARTTMLGGAVLRPTTGIGHECFAVLADPQGATFNVLESATD